MRVVLRLKLFREVRLRSAGSTRRIVASMTLRFREMIVPEAVSQATPSQWQQSSPSRHDGRLAWVKERLRWRRAEAWSGRQGTTMVVLAELACMEEDMRRSVRTWRWCRVGVATILLLACGLQWRRTVGICSLYRVQIVGIILHGLGHACRG